jgi:hypothetical protein
MDGSREAEAVAQLRKAMKLLSDLEFALAEASDNGANLNDAMRHRNKLSNIVHDEFRGLR